MATAPYFRCPKHSSSAIAPPDSDAAAAFGAGALEMAPAMATATTTTADTALVPPESAAVRGRPRRNSSTSGSGKQQQQQPVGGGANKKPPQRGLGVAELERIRCGGDPLRELGGVQVHQMLHCNNHQQHMCSPPTFDAAAANARYCSSVLVQPPPAPQPSSAPGCYVHHPPTAGGPRAPPLSPAEQLYFTDRLGRMGGFSPPPGSGAFAGSDHHAHQLPPLAPEHPSSQSSIWRPAASSSSSCLQSGHRCDLCSRRTMRAFAEIRGTASLPPPAPPCLAATATATPDYSIYDLAAAMTTARQGEAAFGMVRDWKRGALAAEDPVRKEVREIEFFPAAASSTHHSGGGGHEESEFMAPMSYSSYAAAPASLDLSLRL